jgi:hypothetical protein
MLSGSNPLSNVYIPWITKTSALSPFGCGGGAVFHSQFLQDVFVIIAVRSGFQPRARVNA